MTCGLIGRRLGHSYSPQIHRALADYDYKLWELEPEELETFFRRQDFTGVNVTIPYKQAVIPLLDELSETARAIGAVNTVVRRGGKLYGDNTDFAGMAALIHRIVLSLEGKKVLILGTGGTSKTAVAVARSLGAAEVYRLSRSGRDGALTYEDAARLHADADVLINTTPGGMYPAVEGCPVALDAFPNLSGVVDAVYNPLRTNLVLQARSRGIPAEGGLYMLAAQAAYASALFRGCETSQRDIDLAYQTVRREMENIVLIGMPGSGKSTIAALLAERLHRPVLDSDAQIVETAGVSIPDIFAAGGEDAFRARETAALAELGKRSGAVLATGGGSVCRAENYPLLHQNGTIFWLQRDLALLPKDGRPISQRSDLAALYAQREPLYARFADAVIDNNGTPEQTVQQILEVLA